MKLTQLDLPEFGFVDGYGDDTPLKGRNVILCVRSASVVEILPSDMVLSNESSLSVKFSYTYPNGKVDKFVCLLHHSPLLDVTADAEYIKEKIMKPAVKWYSGWLDYKYQRTNRNG